MKRGIYGLIALALLAGLIWVMHRHDKKVDQQITSPVLGPNDLAKVVIDPKKHTITVVDRSNLPGMVSKTYVGKHDSSVVIRQGGDVVVMSRTKGTEVSPFIGSAYTPEEGLRVALGTNLLFYKKYELGGGLLLGTRNRDAGLFLSLSYNVYDNTSLFVGVDQHKQPLFGFSVAF